MRRLMSVSATFVVVLNFVFSSIAFAQQARVIEETLILKDPTVSAAGKWVGGGALEYWYSKGRYDLSDSAGNLTAKGNISGSMPGGNIFAGYDNFTANYAYRNGSWNTNFNYVNGANTTGNEHQKENEFTVRWLIRDLSTKFFTPYLLAGYAQIDFSDTDTLTNAFVWTYNGLKTRNYSIKYKGPLVAVGGIVPVNNTVGFRFDARAMSSSATFTRDDGFSVSGSGVGGGVTGTMYVNIVEGLNLQVGAKYQALNGGSSVGTRNLVGVFAMIGYSFK